MMKAEIYLDIINDLEQIEELTKELEVSQDYTQTIVDDQVYSLRDLKQIILN